MLRVRTSSDTQLRPHKKPVKFQLLKRSLSENVSGEEACGCIQAASAHAMINYGAIKMRDDDARGTWTHGLPFSRYPHLESEEGEGHPAVSPLTYDFGLDVHGFHC
jgi:hypothetical protein